MRNNINISSTVSNLADHMFLILLAWTILILSRLTGFKIITNLTSRLTINQKLAQILICRINLMTLSFFKRIRQRILYRAIIRIFKDQTGK